MADGVFRKAVPFLVEDGKKHREPRQEKQLGFVCSSAGRIPQFGDFFLKF